MFRKCAAVLAALVLCFAAALALADGRGWYCPECGHYNDPSYNFCPMDGIRKPAELDHGVDYEDRVPVQEGNFYTQYAAEYAEANRRLATRTGPGTKYDEPGSFGKAGDMCRILSKAYDETNEIWWVQTEIRGSGGILWAYTGIKRFDGLKLENIPEEKIIGRCRTASAVTGYYAPPSAGGKAIGREVPEGAECAIYGYVEGAAGDYIQVEFYDTGLKQYRRARIPESLTEYCNIYDRMFYPGVG